MTERLDVVRLCRRATGPVALSDTLTVANLALAARERALEPTRLELIPGGHFGPYVSSFSKSSGAARAWFRHHLS